MSFPPKPPLLAAPVIVTGHANADFDCLAAIIAAGKLYPGATLIFPGSQEKNIRHFFIQSATYLFNFKNFKDIEPTSVHTLVLVDTRQRSRVPHIEPVFANTDLAIHCYDHHPDTDEDVAAALSVVKPWGSTTAILMERIMAEDLSLTTDEATILGLGIYEDTGSFTFASTTEHDLAAAAWLRARGMDVGVIADLMTRELSSDQITIMSQLIESAQTHDINGVEVVIAEATSDQYIGDFALLVHKFLDMENLRVLFAIGLMNDRVHLVARSRSPDVDVGRICASLGGGGHPYAASASIKNRTLTQVREELFGLLYSQVNPQILVRQLMSKPAVSIEETATMRRAEEIMTRYGLKALPVTAKGNRRCVGVIEHDIMDKAINHGLGDVPVAEYMIRDPAVVTAETDLYPVMEIILGRRQRLVPVVEDGRLSGVVTRTDLVNTLVKEPARIPESLLPERKRDRNIGGILRERLPKDILELLKKAGDLGREMGFAVYVVGGFVRDLLLKHPNYDVDLVVEGDGIAFAAAMAKAYGGRYKAHPKFKTAVIILPGDARVDVATARLEYYEYPAALPTVELSSIKMDLYRRDFTVNALAVHLLPDRFGELVDFFGAQRDIKERVLRVLHSLSFVEDPTRIVRAIRFSERFGFRIGGQTDRLIKNAVRHNFFHRLSGARVFHELRLILEEKNPLACLRRMQEYKLLAAVHPLLALTPARETVLMEVENVINWYRLLYIEPAPQNWLVYFLALCSGMDAEQFTVIAKRLNFSKRTAGEIASLRVQIRETAQGLFNWEYHKGPLSELYFLLEGLPIEGALFLMARNPREPLQKYVSQHLTSLRGKRVEVTGNDLKKLGVEPGPQYTGILRRILGAVIDGHAPCRSEQLEMARRLAAGQSIEPLLARKTTSERCVLPEPPETLAPAAAGEPGPPLVEASPGQHPAERDRGNGKTLHQKS
ncbi:Polynucleotide adenylyltransferase region [Solidesulfovibrio carbinoliphilus subsp. oakridgensis]|uniref:Polynucleotide adenylyltransferase region n=1 Tax=Solidesulfovibrio carbinoliphilus subsp. oakridgensis TaxID=694327 RepID=G7Q3T6_9BACT|nr:CBS domain-containing protein [Solidesulfovibrio carbinoliphilus]EHJ46726.1 Polynucleotide adenylyltransferase region [Solidesulfovibrio carbinoliphilus subsp. oakridgensis]